MKKLDIILICAIAVMAGCSDDIILQDRWGGTAEGEIDFNCEIDQGYTTRVNDGGFVNGDAIGVYIADYEDGRPSELKNLDNHANNVKFTFNERDYSWSGAAKIFWTDDHTPVDAYSYYPFAEYIPNVTAYPFSVERHQDKDIAESNSKLGGYEASDFLWAKAAGVVPKNTIQLMHRHIMASVQLTLVEGSDFNGTWDSLEKSVMVTNTIPDAIINLQEGTVTAVGGASTAAIAPYKKGDNWRCIVVPQTVVAGQTLISITIDGESYNFTRENEMTYQSGKLHKFTIRVDKHLSGDYEFTLVDESITAWEADDVSHQGEAKVYTVINVPEPGALEAAVKALGIKPLEVENLKLTGTMNYQDFQYMQENFSNIIALNMKELKTVDIPICSWDNDNQPGYGIYDDGSAITESMRFEDAIPCHMTADWFNGGNDPGYFKLLQHVILPDNLKYIGSHALTFIPISGSLDIPEGVKWIGSGVVGCYGSDIHHLTSINLPSGVEYIGQDAFTNCDFTNELILPKNLKYLGLRAFAGCSKMYGQAHLPDGMKYLGDCAFNGVRMSGIAVFPAGIKKVSSAFGPGDGWDVTITGIYLPEGVEEISDYAFGGVFAYENELRGDIRLPNSIKKIGRGAFAGSKISHIRFPKGIEKLERDILKDCKFLTDTVTIPEGVIRINSGFFNGCSNLSAIILPSTLEIIGGDDSDWAWMQFSTFGGCYSLEYLRCDAPTPPTLVGEAFENVPKDNFTLVVPEGSVELYQKAEGWREFKRISAYKNLVFRPQIAKVLNKGGERDVVLNADAGKNWTITNCPDWMHISQMSGKGKTQLKIIIDKMAHGAGDRKGEIIVKLDGTDNTSSFSVSQFDYEYDEDQSYTIQNHSKGGGVNLVIVGDGYDAEDIAKGTYLKDMMQTAEYFFDIEPYKTYREYFNIYTAFAMSYESGIGSVDFLRNSKFKTSYGNGNYDSRINADADAAAFYCLDNTPAREADFGKLTCIITANATAYDGVTVMFSNGTSVAICPKSGAPYPNDARGLVQHEACGHGFAKFADEYVYHNAYISGCKCVCCSHVEALLAMQKFGWGMNLSLSGKMKDLPWKHLLADWRTSDIADVYEGGYFHSRGVYRSEYNSVMNHNEPYFSTWCRELIVRKIMDYAGETFDYESFIAKDSREWGRDFTIGSRAIAKKTNAAYQPGATPVIVKGAPSRNFKGSRTFKGKRK